MALTSAQLESDRWVADPLALLNRITGRIDERLEVVEEAVVLLLARELRASEITDCVDSCEHIARWVFALDVPVAGRIIRAIGAELSSEDLSSRAATGLAAQIDDFQRVIRTSGDDWIDRVPVHGHVHVVSAVDAQSDLMMWHLRRRGMFVTYTSRFSGSPAHPDVMVLVWPGDARDASAALEEVRRRSTTTRRVLLHGRDESVDHLAEVAANTDLMLSSALSGSELAEDVRSVALPDAVWVNRVVLLGAENEAAGLGSYGFRPQVAPDLTTAVAMMSSTDQTIVLGPGVPNPASVVALLRSSRDVRDGVVVVRTSDSLVASKCRQLGADIVVGTDVDIDSWGLHLRGMVSRRNTSREFEVSQNVEIASWSSTVVVFERALATLGRSAGTAALAMIDLPDELSGDGLKTLWQAMSREFRTVDLVGQSEDGLLMVLLRGATREAAASRIQLALDHHDIPTSSGRAGVAEFPIDGYALGEMMLSAVQAADRAKAADGPAVAASDWYSDTADQADVVLVESDHTLASILTQLLDQIGLTTTHVLTGSDALRLFSGGSSAKLPKLIIVELDAMGADGLMILRSLARHGVMSRTKVIVTCARIRDGELREAFELGADDVVVKPFSAVVLSNRIRQVLNER